MPESTNTQAVADQDDVQEPMYPCDFCNEEYLDEDDAYACCRYECPECGEFHRYQEDADECCRSYYCESCESEWRTEGEADSCCRGEGPIPVGLFSHEIADYEFFVDAVRPARLTSIEQELARGAGYVLGAFNEQGFISQDYLSDYNDEGDHTIVKEDGSLPEDGCEIVYGRRELWRTRDAQYLGKQLSVVRALKERGVVRSGRAAGTHIHVAAKDARGEIIGARDVSSLYGAVCHVEDLLYRLAASGWRQHRRDEGSDYSQPFYKGLNKLNAYKILRHNPGRYYAVNFSRLFDAVNSCGCGACRMGAWEDCTCSYMDDATVEWRVFNSSTNPETLHAWVIVAHAMLDRATGDDYSELVANPYTHSATPCVNQQQQIDFLLGCQMSSREKSVVTSRLALSPGITL